MKATQPAAAAADLGPRAVHLVHVGRRPAEVADHAGEPRVRGHPADLLEHRLPAAALNDPALVGRERAERAAAETAADNLDRVLHHFVGRNPLAAVARMRPARERQAVDAVHLRFGQRQGRRIDHHRLAAVKLHQPPGVVGIGLAMDRAGHGGKRPLVGGDLFIAGQDDRIAAILAAGRRGHSRHGWDRLAGAQAIGRAANVAKLARSARPAASRATISRSGRSPMP